MGREADGIGERGPVQNGLQNETGIVEAEPMERNRNGLKHIRFTEGQGGSLSDALQEKR